MSSRAYSSRAIGAVIILLVGLLGLSPLTFAEPVTTIRNNGDPANRVDFVILGDGYTAAEMAKYASDVEKFVNGFFAQEPFKTYSNYFNVHRVDVISNESGADHPERGVYKNTAFDATYNCSGIQRLICVSSSKVNTVLSNSLSPNKRDMVLVLVNDTEYGGSGGSISVSSIHSSAVEIILHEVGHSFGLLADEYDYSPPTCINSVEPYQVNVTKQTDRRLIKWNTGGGPPEGWIDTSTPIPTTKATMGVPGLYEGAKYCTQGLYRPTYNSKMRSLYAPFEQVNEEQLIKRIYNYVSPIDSYSPATSSVTLSKSQSQTFQVSVPQPLTHSLQANWYLNGTYQQSGFQFILNASSLSSGTHRVDVIVIDPTPKVRNDPLDLLGEKRTWTVQVAGTQVRVDFTTSPAGRSITVDGTTYLTPVTFYWTPGESHTIGAPSPQQEGEDTRFYFSSWSDGLGQTHTITAPSIPATFTANFTAQYRLVTSVNPTGAGTVDPSSVSWYSSGQSVSLKATPLNGSSFSSWSGSLTGTANPAPIVINGPKTVTANFVVSSETISTPSAPTGPSNGTAGTTYKFSTGGAVSTIGDLVQYLFDWGDGTQSGWLPVGTVTASKHWNSPGTYTVRVQARCSKHPSVLSAWSSPVSISIVVPIVPQSPTEGSSFGTCSFYNIPTFRITSSEPFATLVLQFSRDRGFTQIPVRVNVSTSTLEGRPNSDQWRSIMAIPGKTGGTVYWRILGTRADRTTALSDVRSFIVEPPQAVGQMALWPTSISSLPTLTWQTNCNNAFRVWFGNDPDFAKSGITKRSISFNINNPLENGGTFTRTLTSDQWKAMRGVVGGVSGRTIYWSVESWDRLNRDSDTAVMSFILTP